MCLRSKGTRGRTLLKISAVPSAPGRATTPLAKARCSFHDGFGLLLFLRCPNSFPLPVEAGTAGIADNATPSSRPLRRL